MLISVRLLSKILKINPRGVLHVGAHHAEEFFDYKKYKWGQVCWIDSVTENIEIVKRVVTGSEDIVIQALVWSEDDVELNFNVASNTQSSSIFKFEKHKIYHPEIFLEKSIKMKSSRLDNVLPIDFDFDFLNLDIQGAELEAIKGLGNLIDKVKYIYSEINKEFLYVGVPQFSEVDDYLANYGFVRILTKWTDNGWGDAVYIKKEILHFILKCRISFAKLILNSMRLRANLSMLKSSLIQNFKKDMKSQK